MAGMSYEKQANYEERWLFPPSLEDLIGVEHPARMIREFVDALNLEGLGFKTRTAEEGRPNYSASLLLKAWLYGYFWKIRSSRGLERACMEQVGMLWLTGMQSPDHTTLWRFWRDNREGIGKLFGQLVRIAASENLVGMVLHALDGTKIVSRASESEGWHRSSLEKKLKQLDEAIHDVMAQTEQADNQATGESRLPEQLQDRQKLREMIQDQLKRMNEEDRDHLNPVDPEARVMKCRSRMKFAYNAQAVVDEQSGLIVAADVVTDESDNYQLVPMLEQVEENLGKVAAETVADTGYVAGSGLAEAEQKHYPVLVNMPSDGKPDPPYDASHFDYDAEKDQCVCPRGEILKYESNKQRDKARPYAVRVYRCQSYATCPVRWQCSKNKKGRTIEIHPHRDALMRQRLKQQEESKREALKKRGKTVEPIFGWCKEGMDFRRWTVCGREKVKTQWLLLCSAMNLRRLYKNWVARKLAFSH
jgi:transposase